MKTSIKSKSFYALGYFALPILIWVAGLARSMAGGCAIGDGSILPSEDACKLAFVYNQEGDHRLVVLDEKNRRRYEAPLDNARMAPFWDGGKVYVLDHSGTVQGFSIGSDKLIPDKPETISAAVIRESEYVRSQHRLFVIQTKFDYKRKISYDLLAIDFPTRKTLWTKRVDDPGIIRVMDQYVCVLGLKLAEVYNCDTGEKIAGVEAAKAIVDTRANR